MINTATLVCMECQKTALWKLKSPEKRRYMIHDASVRQMSDFFLKYAAVNVLTLEVRKLG